MRLFALAAILLLALPTSAQKQQKSSDKHSDVAVQTPSPPAIPAPTVAPGVGYPTTVIQQTSPQQQPYDWPQIFTGIGLIFVGALGVRVGLQTLKKIEIQAIFGKQRYSTFGYRLTLDSSPLTGAAYNEHI